MHAGFRQPNCYSQSHRTIDVKKPCGVSKFTRAAPAFRVTVPSTDRAADTDDCVAVAPIIGVNDQNVECGDGTFVQASCRGFETSTRQHSACMKVAGP